MFLSLGNVFHTHGLDAHIIMLCWSYSWKPKSGNNENRDFCYQKGIQKPNLSEIYYVQIN